MKDILTEHQYAVCVLQSDKFDSEGIFVDTAQGMYTTFIPGKRDGLTINMKHRHKALLKVHFYARYSHMI